MLCLETYGSSLWIDDPFLAFYCTVEEISCVELDAWLVCIDFKGDACGRAGQFGCYLIDVALGVQYPIVIKSFAEFNLLILEIVHICFNGFWGIGKQ